MREWLQRNEIFFKTVAAISLSVMAIIVSFQENTLTKSQVEIEKSGKQPDLQIVSELSESITGQNDNKIGIYCTAGKFYNLQCDLTHIVQVSLSRNGYDFLQREFLLQNTYNQIESTGELEGKIRVISGATSFDEIRDFEKTIIQSALDLGFRSAEVYDIVYLKISYMDFNNESKDIYFSGNIGEFDQVTNKELIDQYFNNRHKFFLQGNVLDLRETSPYDFIYSFEN